MICLRFVRFVRPKIVARLKQNVKLRPTFYALRLEQRASIYDPRKGSMNSLLQLKFCFAMEILLDEFRA